MPQLIDTDYLLANFDISEDIEPSRLEKNIGAASRRLRRWATAALYQSIAAATDSSPVDEQDRKEDFKLAEANLAMHYAVLGLNTPVTSKGIIKSSKAKDFAVLTYFTPPEIADIQRMYLEQAEEIVLPYLATADASELSFVTEVETVKVYGGCKG